MSNYYSLVVVVASYVATVVVVVVVVVASGIYYMHIVHLAYILQIEILMMVIKTIEFFGHLGDSC